METNRRLGRIEKTLETSSHLFELMHERLEHMEEGQATLVEGQRSLVEGQRSLVEGQRSLVEGQRQVIQRLDKLVDVIVRDRAAWVDRFAQLEDRLVAVESKVLDKPPRVDR